MINQEAGSITTARAFGSEVRARCRLHVLRVLRLSACQVVLTFIFVFVVFATAISPFVGKFAPLSGSGKDYGPGKLTPLCLGTKPAFYPLLLSFFLQV